MNSEKTFINGIFIREKEFENGGSIMKVEIPNVNDFAQQLKDLANDNGKISLDIKTRFNKSENGLTHYVELNTFVPQPQNNNVDKPTDNLENLPF